MYRPRQSVFSGLSVFYYPRMPQDVTESFIAPAIGRDASLYANLRLAQKNPGKISRSSTPSASPSSRRATSRRLP